MKIINIPIEPLEERYSIQWDIWFKKQFEEAGLDFTTVYGTGTKGKIIHGSFLDVLETNIYKTSQLQNILKMLLDYSSEEPVILFLHDLWFPGLANIAYIRDGMGHKNLKICGCLHAGSYDKNDFLNKKKMTPWAKHLEKSMFKIVDAIFVATQYHANLLHKERNVPRSKIKVTGFPIYPDFDHYNTPRKKDIVVFPHRLDTEKRPDKFDRLKEQFETFRVSLDSRPNWEFIKTKDATTTKLQYYELLGKSKIAVSFAEQETWGIAMQEAALLGCYPIVPNRLSYSELYDKTFICDSFKEVKRRVVNFMNNPPTHQLKQLQNTIIQRGENAIPNMINVFKSLADEQSI